MKPTVNKTTAEQVLKAVEAKFQPFLLDFATDADGRYDFDAPMVEVTDPNMRPQLAEDWDGSGNWAVVWESNSPVDWAHGGIDWDSKDAEHGFQYYGQALPKSVFCEPYYSFVLVIYPA